KKMTFEWKRVSAGVLILAAILLFACGSDQYSMDDFEKVAKIDAHVHINGPSPAMIEQAQQDNFKLLTVNVDYPDFPPINQQQQVSVQFIKEYPQTVAFASTFSMSGWDDSGGWQQKTINRIDSSIEKGAVAVKVWKNIGMDFRDQDSNLVMIDDPQFDRVFAHIQQKQIPLIGHQGEPKNCWLPIEEMTVNNDKGYFKNHPQYHMYLHPEMPSYEEQMAVRDSMLDKNQDLVFMGAHLASLEWSVDKLAEFLDRYPNAVVDLAARSGQVQYQSSRDREKVRQFFIDYQDRILYATDMTQEPGADAAEFKNQVHEKWLEDWKYYTTADSMKVDELDNKFTGLQLPAEVIDKIFRENALKTFPKAWEE
ncbi:MAG: amidohydrolase family protein, partial [Calditrichia bacterium]